jgi:hypothetical protein
MQHDTNNSNNNSHSGAGTETLIEDLVRENTRLLGEVAALRTALAVCHIV